MTRTITLDAGEFQRVYDEAKSGHLDNANTKVADAHQALGLMAPASVSIGDVTSTICDDMPELQKFVNLLLKFSWLYPKAAVYGTKLKALFTAWNTVIAPQLCGTAAPAPGPKTKDNITNG